MEPIDEVPPPNLVDLRNAMQELGVQGLEICTWIGRRVLRARVEIKWGKYAGSVQRVGWSFPDNVQPFPEYAPHWFHVAGEFDDGKGGGRETDNDETGTVWVAWSRPVGPVWKGPYRTPKNLFRSTVARFWKSAL